MSGTITLREFVTKWGFEIDDKKLKELDSKFAETRENFQKLTDKVTSAGKTMSLYVTAPFLAFAGVSANAAAEAVDVSDKFTAIFKSMGQDGVKAAEDFATAIGVSNVEGQRLLSTQGQILKSMGFTEKQAFSMASSMGTLAADIAEFNSLEGGAAEATNILKSALMGQTRGLKQIGVSIDEVSIKNKVMSNAAAGNTFKTLKQAEAFAILGLVQESTKDAAGAFADSSDEMGVKMQIARARVANLTVTFGKIFLPIVVKLIDKVTIVVDWISSLSSGAKTAIVVVGALAASIGPLLIGLGMFANALLAIKTAYVIFGNAALLAQLKAVALFAVLAIAAAAVGLVIEDIVAFFMGKDSVTGLIVEEFKKMFTYLESAFDTLPGWVQNLVGILATPFRMIMTLIRGVSEAAGALIDGRLMDAGAALLNIVGDAAAPTVNMLTGQKTSLRESLGLAPKTYGIEPSSTTPSPLLTQQPQANNSIVAPITITVPPGTSPEQVGPFVQKGVGDGMGYLLRETSRATTTAVKN